MPKRKTAEPERKSARSAKRVDYSDDKEVNDPASPVAAKTPGKWKVLTPAMPEYFAAEGGSQVYEKRMPLPTREPDGALVFKDYPDFRPNLTPREVLASGSFGGTYFRYRTRRTLREITALDRTIKSTVNKVIYKEAWKEFPEEWFEGLDIAEALATPFEQYNKAFNMYGVKCGETLEFWEGKDWIDGVDPYGQFQWYCRFYLGRRCADDERQAGRANRSMSVTGRWRAQLCNKIHRAGKDFDDITVSPVIRQTLQHWGYRLTKKDYELHLKRNRERSS